MVGPLWDCHQRSAEWAWLSDRNPIAPRPRVPWMIWSALPLGLRHGALMWWFPAGVGELLRFRWFSCFFGGVPWPLHRVEPALLPPLHRAHTKTPEPAHMPFLKRGPLHRLDSSAAWWAAAGALLVGYGAPGYLAMGAAAWSGRGWWAPLLSGLGPGPSRPGSCRRPSGDPKARSTAQLGRIRRNGRLPALWGVSAALGSAAN